ncbi:hypothetical protein SAMN05216338_108032 [Bradyrhizobium sp. Rc2d]|nr:hypothetical protein SAMN05216338_108032 [Bradyrhizobium sp. Rc2d]
MSVTQGLAFAGILAPIAFWCSSKRLPHCHLIQANFKSLIQLLAVYFDPTGPRCICWFRRPATGGADVGRSHC